MTLPDRLQTLIVESLGFVNQHPEHNLFIGHRYRIYTAMGSKYPSCPEMDFIGWRRRTYLCILTTEHVLPLWYESWQKPNTFPQDIFEYPQTLISMAKDVLFLGDERAARKWVDNHPWLLKFAMAPAHVRKSVDLTTDKAKWRFVASHYWGISEAFNPLEEDENTMLRGLGAYDAALRTLYVALNDEKYDCTGRYFLTMEDTIADWYEWDVAYPAMRSASELRIYEYDNLERKEFWEWWLKSAIPQAYGRFQ